MERNDFHNLVAGLKEHLFASAARYLDQEGLVLDRSAMENQGSIDWEEATRELLFHGCDCYPVTS